MRRIVVVIALVSFTAVVLACFYAANAGSPLPPLAEKALKNGNDFELFSLDPEARLEGDDKENFHGWKVLGSTQITTRETQAKLITSLEKGVAENDGTVASCFDPRHGLQVSLGGVVHEFVICFKCYQIEWYAGGKQRKGFLVTKSPKPVFDEILEAADIPLPKS